MANTLTKEQKYKRLLEILSENNFHIHYYDGDIDHTSEVDAVQEMFKDIEELIQTYDA